MSDADIETFWAALPLGRVIKAEEIAKSAVFLASDESSQITGQTIHVNGGHIFV